MDDLIQLGYIRYVVCMHHVYPLLHKYELLYYVN